MLGMLVLMGLAIIAIVGVSMLVSPASYADRPVISVLRRRLVCRLTGLALIVLAMGGAAGSFTYFVMSHYSE